MIFLLNVLLALLGGWLTLWLAEKVGMPPPLSVMFAVIVGILVFLANPGAQVL